LVFIPGGCRSVKTITPVFGFFLALSLFSCDILRDGPFAVAGWTPGTGDHHVPQALTLSILFTRDADRVSVEQAFSLTENGRVLKGSFVWAGKQLFFQPAAALGPDKDYRLSLSAEAHDDRGVSLEKNFEASFSTRSGYSRPEVWSVVPGDGDVLTEPRGTLRITFSEPVRIDSCVNDIFISPAIGGAWTLEDRGCLAVFTPAEPWARGTRYGIKISPDFLSAAAVPLGKEYLSCFTLGDDTLPPVLVAAYALDGGGNRVFPLTPQDPAGPVTENARWETDYRLALDFSEPVDTGTLKARLTAEPALTMVMETEPGYAGSVVFRTAEKPAHGSRFLFKLNSGVRDAADNESVLPVIFRIRADGPYSKPPSLIGIRLPMNPGAADEQVRSFSPDDAFGGLPLLCGAGQGVSAWVELYFDTAPGAAPDLFSVMDLFRVEVTNNALSFSPRNVRDAGFTCPAARPGWESYARIEVQGLLINEVYPGMVTFYIGAGLLDTLGNRNGGVFRIPLFK
jgi:hypothetical protein